MRLYVPSVSLGQRHSLTGHVCCTSCGNRDEVHWVLTAIHRTFQYSRSTIVSYWSRHHTYSCLHNKNPMNSNTRRLKCISFVTSLDGLIVLGRNDSINNQYLHVCSECCSLTAQSYWVLRASRYRFQMYKP